MNKEHLRSILSKEYNADQWRDVLREVFGARSLQQRSKPIALPANNLADAAFELGSFETSDDRLVGLYQVELKGNVRIGQNRVGIRSLLKSIYRNIVDAALVVFVEGHEDGGSGEKWRLSLISEIRGFDPVSGQTFELKTEPKRFTYLLGEGETVRTARDRLLLLAGTRFDLDKLVDTFNVEKLTKDFFRRYKELFGEFCEHLAESKQYRQLFLGSPKEPENGWKDPMAKPIRDFTKILLGRLVFLQFLQKKGWMGVPADENVWENGDARFLKNLFERTKDKDHFHSGALRTLFFETLNRKRKGDLVDATLGEDIRVPYLNGGLFDADISTGNAVDFPQKLFADLLDFFEQYNFTIDEDDPYDREVGIDPEMLGHIFENLLEENREKGAFYTPKEIVHYMCQESLIEYLATHLQEGDRPAIEILVRDNQVATDFTGMAKAREINRLLREVKICDPAIGSGAFPMGLLKEIFECRRLIYPYLKTGQIFHPATLKKEIIQNNIYGVDIDNGAVEIARLRFWLALVVDEIEPAPLPNLDYKIMQGNSLLEQFEDISLVFDKSKLSPDTYVERNLFGEAVNPQTSLMDVLRVQQELGEFDVTRLESEFFGIENPQQKAHIREQLNRLERLVIEQAIRAKESSIRSEIAKINAEIKHKKSAVRADQRDKIIPAATYKKLDKLEKQLEAVEKSKARLQDIRPDNKPYFLWHLYFQDVFEKGGFDIVIANPPYISALDYSILYSQRERDELNSIYLTAKGAYDIYVLFYEASIRLLNPSGTLIFINPNKLLSIKYAVALREFLFNTTTFISLTDVSAIKIFKEASVYPIIVLLKRSVETRYLIETTLPKNRELEAFNREDFVSYKIQSDALTLLPEYIWGFLLSDNLDLLTRIIANGRPLSELGKVNATSTASEADQFGSFFDECNSRESVRVINTGTIDRYSSLWGHREMVDSGNRFLKPYLPLTQVGVNTRRREMYRSPKIIFAKMAKVCEAFLDRSGMYGSVNTNCFYEPAEEIDIRFITAFCNSKVFMFLYEQFFGSLRMSGGYFQFQAPQIRVIPVRIPGANEMSSFSAIVDMIIDAKERNPYSDTTNFERKIDKFFYRIYDLTDDEIAIIEGI